MNSTVTASPVGLKNPHGRTVGGIVAQVGDDHRPARRRRVGVVQRQRREGLGVVAVQRPAPPPAPGG